MVSSNEKTKKAAIGGTGLYAPDRIVTNQYFDELYKKDISTFLAEQRNIRERHWMSKEQSTSDLAVPAALQAMKNSGIHATDLDLIIVATDTPDFLSPSTASVVAYKLGATNAGTYDINSACAGFVTALDVAAKYIATDESYRNILVVGAYAMSKWINLEDYKIATLFADGAGACIVRPSRGQHGYLSSTMYTEAQYHDYMGVYAGGSAQPITHQILENRQHLLTFPKRIPPETNGLHWPRLVHKVLQKIDQRPNDVDHFFITQFNIQSIFETMDRLEVPREKAHTIMDRYGYTGSASIGMALAETAQQGKIKNGDLCFFIGSGGGMSMTVLALEWDGAQESVGP